MTLLLSKKTVAITGYSHKKCYGKPTKNCGKKLSKEHVIPNAILKEIGEISAANVPGVKGQDTFAQRGRSSMTAKILCQRHNEWLGKHIIGTLVRFFRALNTIDAEFVAGNTEPTSFTFSGDILERGFLNLACNHIRSGWTRLEGKSQKYTAKREYIETLFNGAPLPEYWGLYFALKVGDTFQPRKSYSFQAQTHGTQLKAANFWINNLSINLVLDVPSNPAAFGAFRPSDLVFRSGSVAKTIALTWNTPGTAGPIEFKFTGRTSSDYPANWEDWMKQKKNDTP